MKIIYQNREFELQKKEKKIGSEAPAIRLKMLSNEDKVIGMMADKVQVMITLAFDSDLSEELLNIIKKYNNSSLIYLISSQKIENSNLKDEFLSNDFKKFSMKFGVYINDEFCAKSIFIINKDGEVIYRDIRENIESEFNLEEFDKNLDEAIKFKKKGHIHENWMGA